MTPITIARPTIVRTRPPPVLPAAFAELSPSRSSGVRSPSAASAAGASSSRPRTAAPTGRRAGVIRITEGAWIGLSRLIGSGSAALRALLHVSAAVYEQPDREEEDGPCREHRHRGAPAHVALGARGDAAGGPDRVVDDVVADQAGERLEH